MRDAPIQQTIDEKIIYNCEYAQFTDAHVVRCDLFILS